MLPFNKFHTGEIVHNHRTGERGKVVGFHATTEVPQYKFVVVCETNRGRSLRFWSETELQP